MYKVIESCDDFPREISQKLAVTLGEPLCSSLLVSVNWVQDLLSILVHTKQHVAFCVLRTLIGGWTTSYRMHEPCKLPCIFGCTGEKDQLTHYLFCFSLWHICSSVLGIEAPWDITMRLGISSPTPERAKLLALAFMVYHNSKTRAKELGGTLLIGSNHVQRIASESALSFVRHLV